MNLTLIIFLLLGPLLFHLARVLYHYLIKHVLADILDGEVSFIPGYNFFSLSDILIKSKEGTLKCKYFTVSFGDHKSISFSEITTDFDLNVLIKKIITKIQSSNTRKTPFSSLFSYLLTVDKFKLDNGTVKLIIDDIQLKLSTSTIDVKLKEITFENDKCKLFCSNFKYTVDYFGSLPSTLYIMNPSLSFSMKDHILAFKVDDEIAFSTSEPTWRFFVPSYEFTIEFKGDHFPLFDESVNTVVIKDKLELSFEKQILFKIPILEGYSNIGGYQILFTKIEITKDSFQCEKADIHTQSQLMPLLIKNTLDFNISLTFEELNLAAFEDNKDNYISYGKKVKHSKTKTTAQSYSITYLLHSGRKIIYQVEDLLIEESSKFTLGSINVHYALFSDLSASLQKFLGSSIPAEESHFFIGNGVMLNTTTSSKYTMNQWDSIIKLRKGNTLEKSKSMIGSIFPGIINTNHITDVVTFDVESKTDEFKSNSIEFHSLELESIIYMISLIEEENPIEFYGMVNIQAETAVLTGNKFNNSPQWLLSFNLDEVTLDKFDNLITLTSVITDLTEYSFDEFRTSKGLVGKTAQMKLQKDNLLIVKFAELTTLDMKYTRAIITLRDFAPLTLSAEQVEMDQITATTYEYNYTNESIKAHSVNIPLSLFTYSTFDQIFRQAEITELTVSPLTFTHVICSTTDDGFKFSSDHVSIIDPEIFGDAIKFSLSVGKNIEVFASELSVIFSTNFNFQPLFNKLQGINSRLGINKVKVRFGPIKNPLNIAEMDNLMLNLDFLQNDPSFKFFFSIDKLDFYDLSSDPKLILYISKAKPSFDIEGIIREYYIIERLNLFLPDCFISMNPSDVERIKTSFKPLLQKTQKTPNYLTKPMKIENIIIDSFPLSISYKVSDPSSIFNEGRTFRVQVPSYSLQNRYKQNSLQEIANIVIQAIRESTKSIIHEQIDKENLQRQDLQTVPASVKESKGIFSFLNKDKPQ